MNPVSALQISPWVQRWAALIPAQSAVLDLACGQGRHSRYLAGLGLQVLAVDRDGQALETFSTYPNIETREVDLEAGMWPLGSAKFAAVVVTNYLHRPLVPRMLAALEKGGVLIYETFALGNEQFGRPSNPDFLLRPGELLEWVQEGFEVVAYENVQLTEPKPAMVQRICAIKKSGTEK